MEKSKSSSDQSEHRGTFFTPRARWRRWKRCFTINLSFLLITLRIEEIELTGNERKILGRAGGVGMQLTYTYINVWPDKTMVIGSRYWTNLDSITSNLGQKSNLDAWGLNAGEYICEGRVRTGPSMWRCRASISTCVEADGFTIWYYL